jgi:hypothetical protein
MMRDAQLVVTIELVLLSFFIFNIFTIVLCWKLKT